MATLGESLPSDQAALLTDSVAGMTKEQLEQVLNQHPQSSLSRDDLHGIRKLMLKRMNNGQTVFTYDNHNFTPSDDDQDPNTCFCF